jgi:hypothetical protein
VGLAESAFWQGVERLGQAPRFKSNEACATVQSSPAMRNALAPGSVTKEELDTAWAAEKEKARNPLYCEWGYCPSTFQAFRELGENQSWIGAPCSTLFPSSK